MGRPTNLRLDDQLCFALYAATNTVVRAYRPLLREIGLTYPQYLLMLVLWQDGARPVTELATRLALPAHALSPMIDRLQAAGLVARRRDDADRRVVQVHLTEAGERLENDAAQAQRTVACQTQLGEGPLGELRDELRALVARMGGDGASRLPRHRSRPIARPTTSASACVPSRQTPPLSTEGKPS